MIKGFVIGVIVAVVLIAAGIYFYFATGMAPVATSAQAMPFEKTLASMALNARVRKETTQPPSSAPADEPNFLKGAAIYKLNCAMCHGLPGQPSQFQTAMFPRPPQLFKGTGVSDDPASETYWKVVNGIRLSGMPSFKDSLSDTQCWQVSQMLAHSDKLPDSVKKALEPAPEREDDTNLAPGRNSTSK